MFGIGDGVNLYICT